MLVTVAELEEASHRTGLTIVPDPSGYMVYDRTGHKLFPQHCAAESKRAVAAFLVGWEAAKQRLLNTPNGAL